MNNMKMTVNEVGETTFEFLPSFETMEKITYFEDGRIKEIIFRSAEDTIKIINALKEAEWQKS